MWLWIEAGAADEDPAQAGIAHFLEHMVFKGTRRREVGQGSAEIEWGGGDLNAFTSWDHTVLHATVCSEHWRLAVDVLADMARDSLLDADELERERAVVLDEIRSYDEDVGTAVGDALRAALWADHPYGRPVLGTTETVRALTRDQLRSFWTAGWGPARSLLVVVGPHDADQVTAEAERALGAWATGQPRVPPQDMARTAGQVIRLRRRFETPEVQVGWRVPGVGHEDLPALTLAASALGQGSASPLTIALQLDAGVASEPWCDYSAGRAGGSFQLGFNPADDATPEAITLAVDVLERARRGGLAGSTLARTRDALLAQTWFDHETVDGIAADLAWFTMRMGHPEAATEYRRQLAAVRPDAVHAAAERWLDPSQAVLAAASPQVPRDALRRCWQRAQAPSVVSKARPGPQWHTLDNGLQVVIHPDAGRVAAVQWLAKGGALTIGARQAGISAAWTDLLSSGCGPWDAVDFRQRTDALAASFHGHAGPNTLAISSSFPASELQNGIDLLGESLLNPAFDPDEWERVQDELIEQIRTLTDRPDEVAGRALRALMWRGHPWRLPWGGTRATLQRLRPGAIRRWHDRHLDPSRMVLAIAGGVDPALALDLVEGWFGDLRPLPPIPPPPAPRSPRRVVYRRAAGQAQATVIAAVPTGGLHDPARRSLELAAAVLSGPGGRLFLSLRERRGLGYDTWADHRVGTEAGLLTAGVSCAPDRVDEARQSLVAELAAITRDGPTAEELQRVCNLLQGELASSLQRASTRAAFLAGATLFERPRTPQAIATERARVTPEGVRAALAEVRLAQPVVLCVAPRPPA